MKVGPKHYTKRDSSVKVDKAFAVVVFHDDRCHSIGVEDAYSFDIGFWANKMAAKFDKRVSTFFWAHHNEIGW